MTAGRSHSWLDSNPRLSLRAAGEPQTPKLTKLDEWWGRRTSMDPERAIVNFTRRRILSVTTGVLPALIALPRIVYAQDKSGFPDGYDAVQAAPNSHKVIFENAIVRVLEVILPPPGATEPMHHHHWPGFFLNWDTGGIYAEIHPGVQSRVKGENWAALLPQIPQESTSFNNRPGGRIPLSGSRAARQSREPGPEPGASRPANPHPGPTA